MAARPEAAMSIQGPRRTSAVGACAQPPRGTPSRSKPALARTLPPPPPASKALGVSPIVRSLTELAVGEEIDFLVREGDGSSLHAVRADR